MGPDTLSNQLQKAVSNVTKLREVLKEQSKAIAKEKAEKAIKQMLEANLLPKVPPNG